MRALDPALAEHLDGGATTLCRCWRIALTDGAVLGFTDHDRAVVFGGVTFSALDGVEASGDVTKSGLGVGGLEISGAFSSTAFEADELQDGRYDGAEVTLWLVNWTDVSQRVVLRKGTIGEVKRADGAFHAEVRGPAQALETIRGRVVTVACDADLGDQRCKVDLKEREASAVVAEVDGARVTVTGVGHRPEGYFAGGVAVVVDGLEAGERRLIVAHTVGPSGRVLTFREPLLELAFGDTLTLQPGCDKRFETCIKRFQNDLNFQGFPHLPGNDRAFAYARSRS